jgi:mRNA interferase MazF
MGMRRGDLVTVSLSGDYGKPRPALIIQADLFEEHPSLTILPITSELRDAPLFRVMVEPTKENGLHVPSQVMIDKAHTVPSEKLSKPFGRLSDEIMVAINRALAVFLGFAS